MGEGWVRDGGGMGEAGQETSWRRRGGCEGGGCGKAAAWLCLPRSVGGTWVRGCVDVQHLLICVYCVCL
jgi:hypothetical protein